MVVATVISMIVTILSALALLELAQVFLRVLVELGHALVAAHFDFLSVVNEDVGVAHRA